MPSGNGFVKWAGICLLAIGLWTGVVLYVTSVSAKTDANCIKTEENEVKIEKVHENMGEVKEVIHRIDKRQVRIMTKLGVSEKPIHP